MRKRGYYGINLCLWLQMCPHQCVLQTLVDCWGLNLVASIHHDIPSILRWFCLITYNANIAASSPHSTMPHWYKQCHHIVSWCKQCCLFSPSRYKRCCLFPLPKRSKGGKMMLAQIIINTEKDIQQPQKDEHIWTDTSALGEDKGKPLQWIIQSVSIELRLLKQIKWIIIVTVTAVTGNLYSVIQQSLAWQQVVDFGWAANKVPKSICQSPDRPWVTYPHRLRIGTLETGLVILAVTSVRLCYNTLHFVPKSLA